MSHTDATSVTQPDTEIPGVGVSESPEGNRDDSADKNIKSVNSDCTSPDSVRERVLKEVGLTSSTFIGPAFPPQTDVRKSDIEDTLSEFYKELEKIDTPDGANGNSVEQDKPLNTSTSKQTQDVAQKSIKFTGSQSYQKVSGYKQPSWPHWHQNEPYNTRRSRPNVDPHSTRAAAPQNHWHYPPPMNKPPDPRFNRPSFHQPPPPPAFPHPQNPPVNPSWGDSNVANCYQEESHFQAFSTSPSSNVYSPPPQGHYGDYHFDRDERFYKYDTHSDNVNIGWPRGREEDRGRCQRFDLEKEPWEQQQHPQLPANPQRYNSSLVLILMRGLPGSGKSTLARELLSTGPNGVILSTDDYFAHKDGYRYDPGLLGGAHEWNQSRAKDAMHDGRSPVIIDNTNIQAWEMKPYVKMALERGYKVDFCEPDTSWKFDPYELEKRNKHGVHQEKIAQMLDRFSFPISIDIVMNSQEPQHVSQRHRADHHQTMRRNRVFH